MGIRLFFCAVIFLSSSFIGLEFRRRMFIRLRGLNYFRQYFRSVRAYVSHVGMSLDDIAYELEGRNNDFAFCDILREKNQFVNFSSAFADTLNVMQKSFCFTDDDCASLCSFVSKIGSSDIDGALEVLDLADEQLAEWIYSAKEKCETEGKICIVLGLSCGAVVALLFL